MFSSLNNLGPGLKIVMRRVVAATEKNSNSSTRHREAEKDALSSSVVSSLCSCFTFLIFFSFRGNRGKHSPYCRVHKGSHSMPLVSGGARDDG